MFLTCQNGSLFVWIITKFNNDMKCQTSGETCPSEPLCVYHCIQGSGSWMGNLRLTLLQVWNWSAIPEEHREQSALMIMQKDAGNSFKEQVFIHGSEEETGTFPSITSSCITWLDEVFIRDWKASSVVLMDNDASRRKAEPLWTFYHQQ